MGPKATINLKRSLHTEENLRELLREAFFENQRNFTSDDQFVDYTDAQTVINIIKNREVWFRNALVMNDYSEINYGL